MCDLLYEGGVHGGLWGASARKPRYYVLNLQMVIGELNIVPANMKPYFELWGPLVSKETDWANQVPLKFGCNYTHIQNAKAIEPKYFEHAVTIIFVLEKYAEKFRPSFNVYDYLRIIPAHYFIDDFDKQLLDELAAYYAALSEVDRVAKFGANPPDSFEAACLKALDQPRKKLLIRQMAWGFCVTRYVADHLRLFINQNFPNKFHVGRVLASGQNSNLRSAGSKAAAPDLIVPRHRPTSELVPLPLAEAPTELEVSQLNGIGPTDPVPVSSSIIGVKWAPRYDPANHYPTQ